MEQFTKDLTKTLLSNGDVKELFRQQLEKAINQILQAELTSLLGYDPYERNGFKANNYRNGQGSSSRSTDDLIQGRSPY